MSINKTLHSRIQSERIAYVIYVIPRRPTHRSRLHVCTVCGAINNTALKDTGHAKRDKARQGDFFHYSEAFKATLALKPGYLVLCEQIAVP